MASRSVSTDAPAHVPISISPRGHQQGRRHEEQTRNGPSRHGSTRLRTRLGVPLPATLAVAVAAGGRSALRPSRPSLVSSSFAADLRRGRFRRRPSPTRSLRCARALPRPAVDAGRRCSGFVARPRRLADLAPVGCPGRGTGYERRDPAEGNARAVAAASGIRPGTVQRIAREMESVLDFRAARAGDRYSLTRTPNGSLKEFSYTTVSGQELPHHLRRPALRGGDTGQRPRATHRARRGPDPDDALRRGAEPRRSPPARDRLRRDLPVGRRLRPRRPARRRVPDPLRAPLPRPTPTAARAFVGPGRILAARYKGAEGDLSALYFETEQGRGALLPARRHARWSARSWRRRSSTSA